MRGVITLNIQKRKINQSWKYKDKFDRLDTVRFVTTEKGYFRTVSKKGNSNFVITKDELAFVKLIYSNYGAGDYCILIFGKGSNKGFRRFWDGMIINERKFLRRREASHFREKSSMFEREAKGNTIYTESFIGRYMKTKRPGAWHNF